MPTLKLVLSESQYEQLRHEAQKRCTSVTDLVLEAVEALRGSEAVESHYARLARKQAVWRNRYGVDRRTQPSLPSIPPVREQTADYIVEPDRSVHARLTNLRLDLIYHSEALEGSPLTRVQVEDAIKELSPR